MGFVYNGFVCNINSPITLHFFRSRWHLSHAFQLAYDVMSAIAFFMQSPRVAVISKFCSYLACQLKGVMFLEYCVLPDKKLYGNRLYWCKYIRDINGATQRLKATVPDRRVWLPAHALAVRLNNAFKGAKQSPRPCGPLLPKTAPLWKWNTHSKCMCQCAYTYCIVFVYCDCTMYSTVRYSYKCSL